MASEEDPLAWLRPRCPALADQDELLQLWWDFTYACQNNDFDKATELLSHARAAEFVAVPDAHGSTPLYLVSSSGRVIPDFIKLLAKHGCDPNAATTSGSAPLHNCAARCNEAFRPDNFKALLEVGADPNQQDQNGMTPVMIAVKKSNYDALPFLRGHDVDLTVKTTKDQTYMVSTVNKPGVKKQATLPAGSTLEDIVRLMKAPYDRVVRILAGEEEV